MRMQTQRTDLWIRKGETRESEINGESIMNAYTLIYVNR